MNDRTVGGAVIAVAIFCFAVIAVRIMIAKYKCHCIDNLFELEGYHQPIPVTPAPSPRPHAPPTPVIERMMDLSIELPPRQPFHVFNPGDFQVGASQYRPRYQSPRRERDNLTGDPDSDSVNIELPPPAYVPPPRYKH